MGWPIGFRVAGRVGPVSPAANGHNEAAGCHSKAAADEAIERLRIYGSIPNRLQIDDRNDYVLLILPKSELTIEVELDGNKAPLPLSGKVYPKII